ncbi:MAG: LysM peptidoglycan-binding domain-containing protein [Chloroflexi bacterium]|nr:LysM peptidoglycan-binding domain-containing protein [Chloroflexota bacterium]
MNSASTTPSVRHISSQSTANHSLTRRVRSFVALWLLVVTLVAALPSSAQANEDPSQLSPDGERAALLINQLRASAGLSPLRVHPLLTQAANLHILDMTTSGVYGHYGSDGSSVHTRIARTGYVTSGWNGENWAVSVTVDKSIGWWMEDAPHRENVLNRFYTEMGIGTAPHPKGWGLILVVNFSTGNVNGPEGYVPGGGQSAEQQAEVSQVVASQSIDLTPIVDSGLRYRVLPGDTLFSIGQRYGVNWQSIAQLNSLGNRSILQIGTELRIPGGGEPQAAVAQGEQGLYTVAPGDTLLGIALRFGMGWQALAAANGLTERSLLQIGDVLTIPGGTKTTAEEPVSAARTYTVQAGETVWVIAARYSVDWRALLQKNGLSEQALLQIGQVLVLP